MRIYGAVYEDYHQAKRVVAELEAVGLPGKDIRLVADNDLKDISAATSPAIAGAAVGAVAGAAMGLSSGLGFLAVPGVGPVVAAGWLAATAAGALAGTTAGGIVGALVGAREDDAVVDCYSEAIRNGGALVTVCTDHAADEIQPILDRYKASNPAAWQLGASR